MRSERDLLGERPLPQEAYYGINTARLLDAAPLSGPGYPIELIRNIVRFRQAQAVALGGSGAWHPKTASVIQHAADKILDNRSGFIEQFRILPQHGGGARSLVMNVDEVLANIALQELGRNLGEYHFVPQLFQAERETQYTEIFFIAMHLALRENVDVIRHELAKLIEVLTNKTEEYHRFKTVTTLQFREVRISRIGTEFSCCRDGLVTGLTQLEHASSRLNAPWTGPEAVLDAIRRTTDSELDFRANALADTFDMDPYLHYLGIMKAISLRLLRFSNQLRYMIGVTGDLEEARLRIPPAFNPNAHEFIIPDTVSQLAISIIGADATATFCITGSVDNSAAFAPLLASQLVWSGKWLTEALQILENGYVADLTANTECAAAKVAKTPLQAERLVDALGYERAVQVARIAALTNKPVQKVVHKMKLMDEEEVLRHLGVAESEQE